MDSEEILKKTNGQGVTSPRFITHSLGKAIDWCLLFYPKGENEAAKNDISIYLKNMSVFNIAAASTFFLLNYPNYREEVSIEDVFIKARSSWGLKKFVKQSLLNLPGEKFFRNGEIIVGVQITINDIKNPETTEIDNILDDFEKLLTQEKFSDFTVISSEGKSIPVHKNILAIRSPVFAAMFEHEMRENSENTVTIHDIKYEVLIEMFRFIYSSKVKKIQKIVCELLYAAEKYSIDALKLICEEAMLSSLTKQNAISYLTVADQSDSLDRRKFIDFIVKNIDDLIKTPEFKSLRISHPDLMFEIMKVLVEENKKKKKIVISNIYKK